MLCQGPTCLLWCMHVPDSSNLFVLLQHLWRRQGGAAADLQPERGSHPAQVGDCCRLLPDCCQTAHCIDVCTDAFWDSRLQLLALQQRQTRHN